MATEADDRRYCRKRAIISEYIVARNRLEAHRQGGFMSFLGNEPRCRNSARLMPASDEAFVPVETKAVALVPRDSPFSPFELSIPPRWNPQVKNLANLARASS